MTQHPHSPSLAGLSAQIQTGALDPVALAKETLEKIGTHGDQSIFTTMTEGRALEEAKAASERIRSGRSLGLLDGIPIAWKDLFDLRGLPTTAGSIVLQNAPPADRDAGVVDRLARVGMVTVGRVNMSEFAFSGLGINPHYGTPENPRAQGQARIPGGSSSGSAAAVAGGLVPVSVGTDTGGSVRIPAAFTGIVGYKASRGRYPMEGVFPLARSLDSLGPLCRSAQDAVWVDAAMRGSAPPVLTPGLRPSDVTLVIPETVVFDDCEAEVIAAFEAAVARLQGAGVRVRRQAFPAFQAIFDIMRRHGPLVTAEASVLHEERLAGPDAESMDPRVVARTRLGERTTLADYLKILDARARLIDEVAQMIGRGEIIAYPTVAHVAPLTQPLLEDDDLFVKINGLTLRNTSIGNFLDWCGISIPCGKGAASMPVGFLLSGLFGQDESLLQVALMLEQVIRAEA